MKNRPAKTFKLAATTWSLLTLLTATSPLFAGGWKIQSTSISTLYEPSVPRLLMPGKFANLFPNGMPYSPGSGLRLLQKDEAAGTYTFLGVSDRGPNGDAPLVRTKGQKATAAKVFPLPNFQPAIVYLELDKAGNWLVKNRIGLIHGDEAISGRPRPPGQSGSTGEVALDDQLAPLPFDPSGLDIEGIDIDREGKAWLCDEYGPFFVRVDLETGKILDEVGPGTGLPQILKHRQPNRGFEGISIGEDGKIYGIIQSPLDVDSATKTNANFVRIVEFDPVTRKTAMYAYPIENGRYISNGEAKIGDLLWLGKGKFLTIEQGTLKNGGIRNVVVGIDLSGATDLSGKKVINGPMKGKELEFADLTLQGSISAVRKVEIMDLRNYGWTMEKAEGLARIDDHSLAIISDNDFGVQGAINFRMEAYETDGKGGLKFSHPDLAQAKYELRPTERPTQVLTVRFADMGPF